MGVLDWVFGAVVIAFILLAFADFIGEILVPLIWAIAHSPVDGYRHLRYTRHGVCYKCKRKFIGFIAQRVNNVYTPKVLAPVCACKDTKYLPIGQRHFTGPRHVTLNLHSKD